MRHMAECPRRFCFGFSTKHSPRPPRFTEFLFFERFGTGVYSMLFEGVCLDSRHPDHRRAWKGGSEPHFLTPLPRDPADPADPRMNSKSLILYVFLRQKMLGPHSGAMLFSTFSYPSHLKHLFLIVFLEDGLPEMLSKLGVLAERGIKKY